MIENGFYRISNERYHSMEGVSKSDMTKVLQAPRKYKQPGTQEEKDSFIFGDALHAAVLEPSRYEKEYVTLPSDCMVGSGKGHREKKKLFEAQAEANGQAILDPKWIKIIEAMRDEILMHPMVKELHLLEGGEAELSGFYSDPDFENILTKIRPDYINQEKSIIVDLKTTGDPTQRAFENSAYDFGYALQAGMYLYTAMKITGIEHKDFYFIAIEKPPLNQAYRGQYLGCIVYHADAEFINEGLLQRSRALTTFNQCFKTGIWPGYDTSVKPLNLPGWVKRKTENTAIFD